MDVSWMLRSVVMPDEDTEEENVPAPARVSDRP